MRLGPHADPRKLPASLVPALIAANESLSVCAHNCQIVDIAPDAFVIVSKYDDTDTKTLADDLRTRLNGFYTVTEGFGEIVVGIT